MLDGANILEGYRKLGYHTVGTGGVRWFRNPTLRNLFDEFLFFGPDDYENVFTQRKEYDFSHNNQEKILASIKNKKHYFLFLNCLETHVPYDFGEGIFQPRLKK